MIEKIIPDRISFTLPTVFGDELTFLEFCGKLRAKLNESIDGINENTTNIQQNTAKIQQNTAAISRNESDIVKLNGVVNSISAQTDENTVNINTVSGKVDKLSKNFELIEQFTLTEDVTQIYRNQKPNGEAYNFNDVIMTLNIPIIEEGSTEAYGGAFMYIVNSETDTTNNRVVAQGGAFKKGQVSNISVRAKIEGGVVFGTYGASAGNASNKQAAFTSYSNMNMLFAENITSVLFSFFGQPIFSGTTIKIYAR